MSCFSRLFEPRLKQQQMVSNNDVPTPHGDNVDHFVEWAGFKMDTVERRGPSFKSVLILFIIKGIAEQLQNVLVTTVQSENLAS